MVSKGVVSEELENNTTEKRMMQYFKKQITTRKIITENMFKKSRLLETRFDMK